MRRGARESHQVQKRPATDRDDVGMPVQLACVDLGPQFRDALPVVLAGLAAAGHQRLTSEAEHADLGRDVGADLLGEPRVCPRDPAIDRHHDARGTAARGERVGERRVVQIERAAGEEDPVLEFELYLAFDHVAVCLL